MQVPLGLWVAVVAGNVTIAVVVGTKLSRRATGIVFAWLGIDIVLGATGVFAANTDRYLPGIVFGLALPIAAGLWLLSRDVAAAATTSTAWLVGVQAYRVIGVVFVIGWALGYLPAAFALPAGLGDVAVGLAAPAVARRLRSEPDRSRRLATVWNVAGLADLVAAVTLGFLTSPSPLQQLSLGDPNTLITRLPFVLVPVFAVPISVLLHAAALRSLRARETLSPARAPVPY